VTPEQYQEAARVRLGATLKGKWKLDTVLGVGGTAAVYAGSHRNGKRAAIKVLHPELSARAEFRARFLREAYIGNHIEHPGALTVHDDDVTEDGCAFLVMDLLEGENLEARRMRKGGKLPPLEVLSLMDDVLDILAAAHRKGVIHRDIKPENLFLTSDNQVRLLDFGVARLDVPTDPGKTLAGISMGTPAFMPPEQASAHWDKVDESSDLWALGASMFVLLTGTYVYSGGTVNESLVQAITGTAPKVQSVAAELPDLLAAIVDKALQREKLFRYARAADMQVDVRSAYRELQDAPDGARYSLTHGRVAAHSSPPGPSDEPHFEIHTPDPMSAEVEALRPRRRGFVWFSAAGAVAVLIGLFLALSGEDEPSRPSAAPSVRGTTKGTEPVALPKDRAEGESATKNALSVDELPPVPPENDPATDTESSPEADEKAPNKSKGRPRPPTVSPAKPVPIVEPPPEDFDPFEKRH
jgi:eukaryotic-like serine/threonine-protein kinase